MSFRLHPETELGPVKLKVSNLKRSITFYKEIIGFDVFSLNSEVAELTVDGMQPLLILEEVSNAAVYPRQTTLGLYHIAILLPSRQDLGLFLKHVINKGISVGSADHLVSEAIYLEDPDQNGLEIYRDLPRKKWETLDDGDYKMTTERIDAEGLLREAGEQMWQGIPTKTKIGHVHFHVNDLAESRAFYTDVLGFDLTVGNLVHFGVVFLAAGGYHHHIGLNTWAGADAAIRPAQSVGIAYYMIVLPNNMELNKLIEHIQVIGLALISIDANVWVIKDPTGIEIHLSARDN